MRILTRIALVVGITFIVLFPIQAMVLTPAGMTALLHQAALRYYERVASAAPDTSPIPVPRPKEQLP